MVAESQGVVLVSEVPRRPLPSVHEAFRASRVVRSAETTRDLHRVIIEPGDQCAFRAYALPTPSRAAQVRHRTLDPHRVHDPDSATDAGSWRGCTSRPDMGHFCHGLHKLVHIAVLAHFSVALWLPEM